MKYPILASFIIFTLYFTYTIKKNNKKEKNQQEDFWERERLANATRRKPLEDLNYVRIPLDALPMELLSDIPEIKAFQEKLRALSEKKIVNFSGYSNTDLKLAYGAPNIYLLTEYDQNFTDLVALLQGWAAFLLHTNISASAETSAELTENTDSVESVENAPKRPAGISQESSSKALAGSEAEHDSVLVTKNTAENAVESSNSPAYRPAVSMEERRRAAMTILEFAVSIGSDICASYEKLAELYQETGEEEKIAVLAAKANELRSSSKNRILAMLEKFKR